CDALHLETLGEGRFPAEVQIGYLAESKPGECLRLYAGTREGLCYVRGLDLEDVPRFDAVLTLKDIT
ncbi:MAG: acyl-ACP thioesterase, partial [Clostridiales bacterium]|nr:acyl-ACP thioesterase [Clostridiales bacterium]